MCLLDRTAATQLEAKADVNGVEESIEVLDVTGFAKCLAYGPTSPLRSLTPQG